MLLCGCANNNVAHDNKANNINSVTDLLKDKNEVVRVSPAPSTSDTSKFTQLSFYDTNHNGANAKWTSILNSADNPYTCKETAINFLINEGLKLHENNNSYVQTTVIVDENYSTVKIDVRGFGNAPSYYLYVNSNKVIPVYVNGDITIESDGKFNIVDTWSTVKYDLTSYIGQTVTIKLEIQSGGDSAIGGFYFTNTAFSTSDEDAFIGSNADDGNAKTAWTNYKSSPTGAYEYYRNELNIGDQGLKFHVNEKDYLTINDVFVDAINPKWTIDIRGHNNGATYKMEVEGNVVTPTITDGSVATLDGSIISANAGWSTIYYDLTSYSGKRVTVKLSITNGGDSMVGGFYFASAEEYVVDAIKYARNFNTDIQQNICKSDGTTNETDLKNAWNTYSTKYTELSSDDSRNLLNGTTTSSYTDISYFLHNYDEILRLRGTMWSLNNYMNRVATSSSNVLNKLVGNDSSNVALLIFITLLVASTSFAVPYFIKKRKQQN